MREKQIYYSSIITPHIYSLNFSYKIFVNRKFYKLSGNIINNSLIFGFLLSKNTSLSAIYVQRETKDVGGESVNIAHISFSFNSSACPLRTVTLSTHFQMKLKWVKFVWRV